MAQVILLCGKLCSGKSTYAKELQRRSPASVLLSCDKLMLSLFPDGAGNQHDMLSTRARRYLFALSLDILATGADVILDWGFWTKAWRDEARAFYQAHGVSCSLHYIDASPTVLARHIATRNDAVIHGKTTEYFVDEGLLAKMESQFEKPTDAEINVRYRPE